VIDFPAAIVANVRFPFAKNFGNIAIAIFATVR
jgi:hypothetical protein